MEFWYQYCWRFMSTFPARLHGAMLVTKGPSPLPLLPVIGIDYKGMMNIGRSCSQYKGDLYLTPAWLARKTHNNTMEVPVKCFPRINLFIILHTLEGRYGGEGDNCELWGQKGLKFVLYNGVETAREGAAGLTWVVKYVLQNKRYKTHTTGH